VLLRLSRDLFALFVQQYAKISTETERRASSSAIAEHLVLETEHNLTTFRRQTLQKITVIIYLILCAIYEARNADKAKKVGNMI